MKIETVQIQYFLFFLFLSCTAIPVPAHELKKEIQYTQHKFIPFYNLKKAGNTIIFQGNKKKKNYFEGWYFKMVSNDGSSILSIIPGISLSADGSEQHAFIQIINGITAQTSYHSFPSEEFSFSKKEFAIKIGESFFSKDSIVIDIRDDNTAVSGKITMTGQVEYKSDRLINPAPARLHRVVYQQEL